MGSAEQAAPGGGHWPLLGQKGTGTNFDATEEYQGIPWLATKIFDSTFVLCHVAVTKQPFFLLELLLCMHNTRLCGLDTSSECKPPGLEFVCNRRWS